MYYKKCEGKKCQEPKKPHNECEVAYYEVKKHDKPDKCKCEIEKTEFLIDEIEHKAEAVLGNIEKAEEALVHAGQALKEIPDLGKAVELLDKIASTLACFAGELAGLAVELCEANKDIHEAEKYGKQAFTEIEKAEEKQEEILKITEKLEEQFEETVHCLKKDDGFPILVPVEKDKCHHKGNGWDCDCKQ